MTHNTNTSNEFYVNSIKESPFLDDRSKTTILTGIKRMISLSGAQSIHDLLMNPDKYGEKLSTSGIPDESLKTYMTGILSIYNYSDLKATHKVIFNKWYKWYLKSRKVITRRRFDRVPTERMLKAHMDWEVIVKRVLSMSSESGKDYVLMCMITMIPPRRQADWSNVRVYIDPKYKPPPDHNYMHLYWDQPYILLTNYKTNQYYGNWYKKIPSNLLKVLRQSLQDEPRDYLFMDATGKPFKRVEAFTLWSNRAIKKILDNEFASMNMLRHSFASYIQRVNPNMTMRERYYIAKDMGHSIMQNIAYDFNATTNNFNKETFTDVPRLK